jgi:hypothetical protein
LDYHNRDTDAVSLKQVLVAPVILSITAEFAVKSVSPGNAKNHNPGLF